MRVYVILVVPPENSALNTYLAGVYLGKRTAIAALKKEFEDIGGGVGLLFTTEPGIGDGLLSVEHVREDKNVL